MQKKYKQKIIELLMKTEYIEMGFTEGSTLDVYKEILEIIDEMELKLSEQDNTENFSEPITKLETEVKSLERELMQYKIVCLDLVSEINKLRNGMSVAIKTYKEIDAVIADYKNVRSHKNEKSI